MNEVEEEFVKSLKALLVRYNVVLDATPLNTMLVWYFANEKEKGNDSIFLTVDQVAYEISK